MDRRTFMISGLSTLFPFHAPVHNFTANLFTLGVASSLKGPNAVTPWTWLAIDPLEPTGGLPHMLPDIS